MKVLVLAALLACAAAAPQRLVIPRLPLNVLLRGNVQLIEPTIVGGVEATPGQIPFQISMQVRSSMGLAHICGGSVYNENWVISACHCVDGSVASEFVLVAGEHDLASDDGAEQLREVSEIIMHPNYDSFTISNDISLLKLTTPFDLSGERVKAVELPAQGEEVEAGTLVSVSGWGTLHSGDFGLPDILHIVDVPIVTDEQCRGAYGQNDVFDSMICAGRDEGGVDSCQGDSGGPLFLGNTLIGVVSWGYGCAVAGYPGVYTQVSYFSDWVKEQTATA